MIFGPSRSTFQRIISDTIPQEKKCHKIHLCLACGDELLQATSRILRSSDFGSSTAEKKRVNNGYKGRSIEKYTDV